MLDNFWKLKAPWQKIESQDALLNQLKISEHVSNILYQPETISPLDAEHPQIKIHNKSFTNVSFSRTTISNTVFVNCTFTKCLFIGTKFVSCKFSECNFTCVNTWNIEFTDTYIDPYVLRKAIPSSKYSNIGIELYQSLFRNLKNTYQPELLRSAEYYFLVWNRKHKLQKFIKLKKIKYLFDYISLCLQQLIGYGVRFRWLFVTLILLFSGTCLFNYYFWESFEIKPDTPKSLANVMFYTFYTVASYGSTPWSPSSTRGIISAITQGLIGWTSLGVGIAMIIKRLVR